MVQHLVCPRQAQVRSALYLPICLRQQPAGALARRLDGTCSIRHRVSAARGSRLRKNYVNLRVITTIPVDRSL
jgi:hypothetical protein